VRWRRRCETARQVRLSRLLRRPDPDVVPLDRVDATAVGRLLVVSGTADVVDTHVVLCARCPSDPARPLGYPLRQSPGARGCSGALTQQAQRVRTSCTVHVEPKWSATHVDRAPVPLRP